MDMLSISSSQARSPFCLSTIVHLTQDLKSSLYEQLLILTPIVMKYFKKLVMNQVIPGYLDPLHPVSPHSDSDSLTYGVKTQQHLHSLCRLKKVFLPYLTIFYGQIGEKHHWPDFHSLYLFLFLKHCDRGNWAHTAEEITATSSGPLYWGVAATQSVW